MEAVQKHTSQSIGVFHTVRIVGKVLQIRFADHKISTIPLLMSKLCAATH